MSASTIVVLAVAAAFTLYLAALVWVFFYTRAWAGPETSNAAIRRKQAAGKTLAAAE